MPARTQAGDCLFIASHIVEDEEALHELSGPVLKFKEIPNAPELAALLEPDDET